MSLLAKKRYDHIVIICDGGSHQGYWHCKNCGDYYLMNVPCSVNIYVKAINEYSKIHKKCKEVSK